MTVRGHRARAHAALTAAASRQALRNQAGGLAGPPLDVRQACGRRGRAGRTLALPAAAVGGQAVAGRAARLAHGALVGRLAHERVLQQLRAAQPLLRHLVQQRLPARGPRCHAEP